LLFALLHPGKQMAAQIITTYNEDGSAGTIIDKFDQTPVYAGPELLLFTYFENNVYVDMPAKSNEDVPLSGNPSVPNEYVIVMAFSLDETGIPQERRILSSDNLLMNSAFEKALYRMPGWTPAIINGEYEKVTVILPLRYTIEGRFIDIKGYDNWMYASSG
ncbi:MAG: hypothetical protein ACK4IY_02390, partial [Chitinophagales bacterium]